MTSYRDLLNQALTFRVGEQSSVSIPNKPGAVNFDEIRNYNFLENPTVAMLQPLLGVETSEDTTVLGTQTSRGPVMTEFIHKEGDTCRLFNRQVSGRVGAAATRLGIVERSEVGPSGQDQTTTTVDSRMSFGSQDVMVVELKAPYAVEPTAWRNGGQPNTKRDRLTKQLRM